MVFLHVSLVFFAFTWGVFAHVVVFFFFYLIECFLLYSFGFWRVGDVGGVFFWWAECYVLCSALSCFLVCLCGLFDWFVRLWLWGWVVVLWLFDVGYCVVFLYMF